MAGYHVSFTNTMLSTPTTTQWVCMHEISGELVVYDDGVLAGYCKSCGTRIVLESVPVGDIPARVSGLLAEVVASDKISADLRSRINQLRQDLRTLEDLLDESKELLRVLDSVMAKRSEG